MSDEARLHDLAGAIVDGAAIDWASAESGAADESLQSIISDLKVIAAIADLHRSMPLETGAGAAGPPARPAGALGAWGTLQLLEKVGEGAYGEVYRAWDTRLDRQVALKLLPADPATGDAHATSMIQEGRLLARVRHPNVVTIHGAERIEDRIGLWMEFIQGSTLEQRLDQGHTFSDAEAIHIGLELCRAVSAVHAAGLLHRDIKTHNVMLADDGRVVLMDFGSGREQRNKTGQGLAGTPLYIAPELLRGEPASVRSDIYSLGVLLFHLLTGAYPVKGPAFGDLKLAHQRGDRLDIRAARPGLSRPLARIVERAIDPEPARRYHAAGDMARDLQALRPRSIVARAGYALGTTAVLLLLAWLGLEWRGRETGSPDPPVIVVLPFENLGAEPESDLLVEGLTTEILHSLSTVDGLQVRARDSSFAFRNAATSLADIARRLDADLFLQGAVRWSGPRVRVNVRLVRADGTVMWSDQFDRERQEILSVQNEISREIVTRLQLNWVGGQRRYDAGTYDLYLKGRALLARGGARNLGRAAELFEQVLAGDAAFAPAYAGLATTYARLSLPLNSILPFGTAHAIMRPAAERALARDASLAEAHASMGWVYSRESQWSQADEAFRRAIDLDPGLSETYTAYSISTLQPLERYDEALRILTEAQRNDPLSLDLRMETGAVQLVAGRYEDAVGTLEAVRADEPDRAFVEVYLGRALMFAGRLTEALPMLEGLDGHHLGRLKTPRAGRAPWLARAYVLAGRRAEAEALLVEHRDSLSGLAIIHAALGDKERAFEALERMVVTHRHHVGRMLITPELAPLRSDPRFRALREKVGLPAR
jgi:eukaryotic-like serine/threonine-protein kinase